jgi:hypothetical protein
VDLTKAQVVDYTKGAADPIGEREEQKKYQ